jgi:hypothetical protein
MKNLLRVAGVLAFLFCGLAGLLLISAAMQSPGGDMAVVVSIGLLFVGNGLFVGAMLLFAAERVGQNAKG